MQSLEMEFLTEKFLPQNVAVRASPEILKEKYGFISSQSGKSVIVPDAVPGCLH
jgi:hypothetical protein